MKMKKIIYIILLLSSYSYIWGQSQEIYTPAYTNDINGPGYLSPLANAIATNLNSHIFTSHYKETFGVSIGVIGIQSITSDAQRTHNGMTEGLSPNESLDVPTIFGNPESLFITDGAGNLYSFPGGFSVNTVTFLVPQITISGLAHTDISFRYFAYDFGGRFGELSLIGGGIRHHINQYFTRSEKIKMSLGYTYNQLIADNDIITTTIHSGILEASYFTTSDFAIYGQVQYLDTTLEIDYTSSEVETNFSGKGNQKIKLGAGLSYNIHPVYVRAGLEFFNPVAYSAFIGVNF
jgi:hypothetical protein